MREEREFGLSLEFHYIWVRFQDGVWNIAIMITRASTEP